MHTIRANQDLVALIERIAQPMEATLAQVALAWLLAQKPWIVPTAGTTKLHRLDENLGAVDVELSSGDLEEIEGALERIHVQGNRYSEASQSTIDR